MRQAKMMIARPHACVDYLQRRVRIAFEEKRPGVLHQPLHDLVFAKTRHRPQRPKIIVVRISNGV